MLLGGLGDGHFTKALATHKGEIQPCGGREIERGENGILRFDIAGAYDSNLEYHPNGTTPAGHTSGYGYPSPPVASAFKVAEKWFFVRYSEVQ